jgi:hypothetical protein
MGGPKRNKIPAAWDCCRVLVKQGETVWEIKTSVLKPWKWKTRSRQKGMVWFRNRVTRPLFCRMIDHGNGLIFVRKYNFWENERQLYQNQEFVRKSGLTAKCVELGERRAYIELKSKSGSLWRLDSQAVSWDIELFRSGMLFSRLTIRGLCLS